MANEIYSKSWWGSGVCDNTVDWGVIYYEYACVEEREEAPAPAPKPEPVPEPVPEDPKKPAPVEPKPEEPIKKK
jgi:hypothetical protein